MNSKDNIKSEDKNQVEITEKKDTEGIIDSEEEKEDYEHLFVDIGGES